MKSDSPVSLSTWGPTCRLSLSTSGSDSQRCHYQRRVDSPVSLSTRGPTHRCHCQRGVGPTHRCNCQRRVQLTGFIVNVGSESPVSLSTWGPTHRCHCQRGVRLTGVIVKVGSDSTLSLSTCSHHLNVESHSKCKLENCDTICRVTAEPAHESEWSQKSCQAAPLIHIEAYMLLEAS
jgi:hypothetical protein